jgi:hypothetical protein
MLALVLASQKVLNKKCAPERQHYHNNDENKMLYTVRAASTQSEF